MEINNFKKRKKIVKCVICGKQALVPNNRVTCSNICARLHRFKRQGDKRRVWKIGA